MDIYEPQEVPIEITPEQISEEALNGIIEHFILREGTDYGAVEVSLEAKMRQVRKQIEKGDIKIVYDQSAETVSLLTARDFKNRIAAAKSS
jgi:uncharacterized protein YheU (UPF0270 family)